MQKRVQKKLYIVAGLWFSALVVQPAYAGPISTTGSTTVTKGLWSTEFRAAFSADDEGASNDSRLQFRQHVDYGVTDTYALRVVAFQDKRKSADLEHGGFRLENRFHIIKKKDYGWDGGFRLAYDHRDGDKLPHSMTLRFQAQVPLGERFRWRQSNLLSHAVGAQSRKGVDYELRNSIAYTFEHPIIGSVKDMIEFDLFNDFGRFRDLDGYNNADHEVGIAMFSTFAEKVNVGLRYRRGISNAATDHAFTLLVSKKF